MFTSYAQNFEDVILWRALRGVENGFYIDVGAQDPVVDSVSRSFYEKGWRGIHAEATGTFADKLRRDRPDEHVEQAAIGGDGGPLMFFEVVDTGLSTGDVATAARHRAAGREVRASKVPTVGLASLLDRAEGREIHWLKIDVEGMEASVIESWRPSPARPWIVVVESTVPNSPEPNHGPWEATLLSYGYRFVYFDGLNRFYVSDAHADLARHFGPGPNCFDEFLLAETSPFIDTGQRDALLGAIEQLKASNAELVSRLDATAYLGDSLSQLLEDDWAAHEAALETERNARRYAEQALADIRSSTSWRVTAPVRGASELGRRAYEGGRAWAGFRPNSAPHRAARRILVGAVTWVRMRPRLAGYAVRTLQRVPVLERRLRVLETRLRSGGSGDRGLERWFARGGGTDQLSPRELRILADIREGIGGKA